MTPNRTDKNGIVSKIVQYRINQPTRDPFFHGSKKSRFLLPFRDSLDSLASCNQSVNRWFKPWPFYPQNRRSPTAIESIPKRSRSQNCQGNWEISHNKFLLQNQNPWFHGGFLKPIDGPVNASSHARIHFLKDQGVMWQIHPRLLTSTSPNIETKPCVNPKKFFKNSTHRRVPNRFKHFLYVVSVFSCLHQTVPVNMSISTYNCWSPLTKRPPSHSANKAISCQGNS